MPDQTHDKGYKRILSKKKNFLILLKSFVKESWVELINEDALELIDKQFIPKDFKEKESDIIYKMNLKGKEIIFYCLIELQSTVDHTMPFRLLIYMTELWRRIFADTEENERTRVDFRLPVIVPIVLYNHSQEWTVATSFKEYLSEYSLFGNRVVDFQYILLNVNNYDDDALKEIGNLIASVFLLDKDQTAAKLKEGFLSIAQIFTEFTEDEQIDFIDWLKDVLAKKAKARNRSLVDETVMLFRKGDVNEMTYAIERIFDRLEEEGYQKGKVEGINEGKLAGKLEGKREGKLEGKREGKREGKLEATIEIAKAMLADQDSVEKVFRVTQLPISTIEKLRDELSTP